MRYASDAMHLLPVTGRCIPKLTLLVTGVLLLGGCLILLFFEWANGWPI